MLTTEAAAKGNPRNEYERVHFHGQPVTARQRQALNHVENLIGFEFWVPQGSWRPITTYSGATHHGAGACDIQFPRMDEDKFFRHVLTVVKRDGRQAAFGRGPQEGMPLHIHVLDLDTHGMDDSFESATWQVGQWRLKNNGLDAGVTDRYPWRPDPIRKWQYEQ